MPDHSHEKQVTDRIPKSYKIYGNILYRVTVAVAVAALFVPVWILADPGNNVLNPNIIFSAIFEGASPEEVWAHSISGGFPGAHFYLEYITKADSWALLFANIGCGVGLFGLVPAAAYQAIKERDWFCAVLGAVLAALIFLSMIGVLSIAG